MFSMQFRSGAGISIQGRTVICIFEGIMDASVYVDIIQRALIPFVHKVYPDGHRFMQDNDSKHVSNTEVGSRLSSCQQHQIVENNFRVPIHKGQWDVLP